MKQERAEEICEKTWKPVKCSSDDGNVDCTMGIAP